MKIKEAEILIRNKLQINSKGKTWMNLKQAANCQIAGAVVDLPNDQSKKNIYEYFGLNENDDVSVIKKVERVLLNGRKLYSSSYGRMRRRICYIFLTKNNLAYSVKYFILHLPSQLVFALGIPIYMSEWSIGEMHAGKYLLTCNTGDRCQLFLVNELSDNLLYIDSKVDDPPVDSNAVIKQGSTISTIEGNSTTLVCDVRGGNPLSTVIWDCFGLTGTSSADRVISRSTLNFIAQRSYNRRTCTCKASHPTVNLGNGPTSISYQPETMSYTRNEGENLGPIQCVSDCNPKCNFVWTRPGQSDYNGDILTISGITRTQEGKYKCTASNSYGNGPDPVILTPSTNTYIVNETFQLGPIKCSATCKPACSYKWIRPNQNDIIDAAKPTSMGITGNNFTVLEHSTKTITCLVEGLPQPTITLTYISNSSQPRAEKEPLENRYTLSVGKTLNITVSYLAYPRPTFQWYKNDSGGSLLQITDDKEDIQINNSIINTYTFVIQLIRLNLQEDGFGTYILKSNNDVIGPKEDVYIVGAKGKPQKPRDGHVMCIDFKSAVITWKPGFFNGDNQTFSVIYREKDGTEQISVSNISDTGYDKYINHTINSLQGARTYFFMIYSRNTLGESPPLEVNCTTKDIPDSGTSTGLAVGAGLGSAIVIIIIVVIVIFLARRFNVGLTKGKRDVEMNGRSALTSGDEQEDGMRDNVLYEPAGPNFVKPGISGGATGGQNDYPYAEVQETGKSGLDNPVPVYAEVQKNLKKEKKPDMSALYADVQKPKKEDKGAKSKKVMKKGKNEKQKQGDLYENVENVNKGNFTAAGPALVKKQNQTKLAKPPKAPKRNKDGLIYADLDLEEPVTKPGQKLVIRGLEDRTDYAEIDITRCGDPLPSDDKPKKNQNDSMS
ncbi:hypothetical protein KUTeg_008069 [Tegillarca granosa]|uniref:Uncharacterized protein n=1 Tax=Tegillarca granosa TaxID=220873 RepID=A0ABQ9F817_TEGGR|nr:hypothetical protein KUTeg_008069 [Tegillarca granosa]